MMNMSINSRERKKYRERKRDKRKNREEIIIRLKLLLKALHYSKRIVSPLSDYFSLTVYLRNIFYL